jgi:hypothetical protein
MSSSSDCIAYAERADVEIVYGRTNVEKWASLDNDQDEEQIGDRITWACCLATERLNNDLRNGPYEIPFLEPCREVVDLTARLAGTILYDSRGITDTNTDGNPMDNLAVHRRFVKNRVVEICQGRVRLNHTEKAVYYPQVASDD